MLRRSMIVSVAGSLLAVAPGLAVAQAPEAPRFTGYIGVHAPDVFVPEPGVAAAPPARIIYLNDCMPDGCVIRPGSRDDSRIDQSAIVDGSHRLSPWAGTAEAWERLVACVRENYAPFTVRVVTEDPGDVPHFEAYVAGAPEELRFPANYGGVASFACGVIPNAVSFTFANPQIGSITRLCATVSQETAHNFGLMHEMLAEDAMTYIPLPTRKRFVDARACIGTQGCCMPASECSCGQTDQNSHQRLVEIFGAVGATPPDVAFVEPGAGQIDLLPGFAVRGAIEDWDGVAAVELLVDDVAVASTLTAPYVLRTPAELSAGTHRLTLRATDLGGLAGEASIMVGVIAPCTSDDVCAPRGPGWICRDDGRCAPPPPAATDDADGGGGCRTAHGASPAGVPFVLALPLLAARRRRRSRRADRQPTTIS